MILTAVKCSLYRLVFMERPLFILSVAVLFVGFCSELVNAQPTSSRKSSIVEPIPELKAVASKSEPTVYPKGTVPNISIHQAAAEGNIEVLRQHILVQAPDYINTKNGSGWTPLHFAYAKGQKKTALFLLENGARYEARNNLGQAPYDIVLLKNNFKNSSFALVELFTSEACSSCPPAERLTSEIRQMSHVKGLKVYCVSFHVDYFDGANWKDKYSNPVYSARQRAYEFKKFSGMYYTPQMIVNGDYQTLGHNRIKAYNAINRALKKPSKVAVSVRQIKKDKNFISVNACAVGEFVNSALCVVLVENGIQRRITGGENKGRILRTDNVVLDFKYIEIQGAASKEFHFSEKITANRNFSVVSFVQRIDSMSVLGAHATMIRQLGEHHAADL